MIEDFVVKLRKVEMRVAAPKPSLRSLFRTLLIISPENFAASSVTCQAPTPEIMVRPRQTSSALQYL